MGNYHENIPPFRKAVLVPAACDVSKYKTSQFLGTSRAKPSNLASYKLVALDLNKIARLFNIPPKATLGLALCYLDHRPPKFIVAI